MNCLEFSKLCQFVYTMKFNVELYVMTLFKFVMIFKWS